MENDQYTYSLIEKVKEDISHYYPNYILVGNIGLSLYQKDQIATAHLYLEHYENGSSLEKYHRYKLHEGENKHFWSYLDSDG